MSAKIAPAEAARWAAGIWVLLTLIGSVRIASTYRVFSHTIDENAHLAAGMQWLDQHKYEYEDQHPPLTRVVGALVPYLAGERSHHLHNIYFEGFALLGYGEHYDRVLALGRSGILIFYWIGSAAVFLWARRMGNLAAVFATAFFTTTPAILAHSGLITTDMGLTAFTVAAVAASLWWARKPNLLRSVAFGALVGCAILSKFSSIPFLPSAWLAMYAWRIFCEQPKADALRAEFRRCTRPALLALLVSVLVIWAGYRFTFGPVEFLGGLWLPAPHFFTGIRQVWIHNEQGHRSYLLGRISDHGFWYYYPVVLSVKTPLAMLLLVVAAFVVAWKRRDRRLGMPLAFAAGILLLAVVWSNINIGVRHILPVYGGFSIACGALASRSRRWLAVATLALAWQVASGIAIHPDYIAYTNALAGSHPENVLIDSDLDWGQDMNRLHHFFQSVGAKQAAIHVLNFCYGVQLGHSLPKPVTMPEDRPAPGWNAIGISSLKLDEGPKWAEQIPPLRRIGRTIYVWYVEPPRDASGRPIMPPLAKGSPCSP